MPAKKKELPDAQWLDALRIHLRAMHVALTPGLHQISDPPVDEQLEYYLLPKDQMHEFKPLHTAAKAVKHVKMINYERPAISLSFYSKHKYSLKRDISPAEITAHLQSRRDELLNKSLLEQAGKGQLRELKETDELLRIVRSHPERFQACLSNYHHYYRYWYCTYRYFDDPQTMKTTTLSEHMLKHTERVADRVHQKLNIIFIDPEYIKEPVPYSNDNKLIDRELATFSHKIKCGITTLYLKGR